MPATDDMMAQLVAANSEACTPVFEQLGRVTPLDGDSRRHGSNVCTAPILTRS